MKYFNVIFLIFALTDVVRCCSTDADCSVPGTTCSKGVCVCNKGYVLSTDQTECLPYVTEYNAACLDDAQCEWLGENSQCKYVCRCKEGYRWYLGQCKQYVGLGGDCSPEVDCFDGYNLQSLTCNQGKCVCSEGYYQRGNMDCRKKATKENDICALNIDCQTKNKTSCIVGKCKQPSEILNAYLEEIESVNLYAEISPKSCNSNEDCDDPNSECYDKTGTCICKHQYFFSKDGSCIPELGVNTGCKNDTDCLLKPGKCEDGACYCRDYYFAADGNRKCVKTMSETNTNCLSKEWCYAWGPNVYCTSNEICQCSKIAEYSRDDESCVITGDNEPPQCKEDYECKYIQNGFCVDEACGCKKNYFQIENRCIPDIGAPCDNVTVCEIENSECYDGHCRCINNYVSYENKACYKQSGLGEECEKDIQCSTRVLYAECSQGVCSCDDKHLEHDSGCVLKTDLNGYCNNRLECIVSLPGMEDSIACRNFKCQCPTGLAWDGQKCSSATVLLGNAITIVVVLVLKGVFSVS